MRILPESSKCLSTALWWASIDSLSLFTEKPLFWNPLKVLLSGSNVVSLLGSQPQEALWSKCNRDANHNTILHGKIITVWKPKLFETSQPRFFLIFFYNFSLVPWFVTRKKKMQQLLCMKNAITVITAIILNIFFAVLG